MAVQPATKAPTQPPVSPGARANDGTEFALAIKRTKESAPPAYNAQQAANDINKLYNMDVGQAQSINDKLAKAGLADKKVDRNLLSDDLKRVYDNFSALGDDFVTWRQVYNLAENRGWAQLDKEFMKIVNGDFSGTRPGGALDGLFDGKGAELNTANIKLGSTDKPYNLGNLPQLKAHLENNDYFGIPGKQIDVSSLLLPATPYFGDLASAFPGDKMSFTSAPGDTMTIASAFDLVKANSWNKKPINEKEFMSNVSMVADGKTDGIAQLGQAINDGWVGVKNSDKIGHEFIMPGSNLDKLLSTDKSDPESRYNINYGQLLDRVSHESTTQYNNATNELTQHLSELYSLVNPDFLGSPGNDAKTLEENLAGIAKQFDSNDPNSRLSQISAKYDEVFADMKRIGDMGITKSPGNKTYLEDRMKDIAKVQERTGQWFNNMAGYLNQSAKNVDYIKDEARREQTNALLQVLFSGLAAVGSIGFGVSNGRAVLGQWSKNGWKSVNLPALFGSGTLFANNAVNTAISGTTLEHMKETWKNVGMSEEQIAHMETQLSNSRQGYQKGLDELALAQRRIEFAMAEEGRFNDYFEWANGNKDKSSLWNANADDSAYTGPMPYKWWTPGGGHEGVWKTSDPREGGYFTDQRVPEWFKGYY